MEAKEGRTEKRGRKTQKIKIKNKREKEVIKGVNAKREIRKLREKKKEPERENRE